ncbi:MAG: biopolymer transporter ExbD [Burkholderiaceae bacterium]|nr:biopolymer transporter ExbD [Burkholderiaceae bacterium]
MAFGSFNDEGPHKPMADINVTPMVDVMLVLLVIFIITAPLFTHAVKLDLPQAQTAPAPEKPETISLSIDGQGRIFWGNDEVAPEELPQRMVAASQKQPLPSLHLRADKETRYDVIAQVMATAQSSGLTKIAFVTEPQKAK